MKLDSLPTSFSPLVVTEHGTGFLCARTRELRKAFGVHVSPVPRDIRPATEDEARAFFTHRAGISADLSAFYARPGVNSGD